MLESLDAASGYGPCLAFFFSRSCFLSRQATVSQVSPIWIAMDLNFVSTFKAKPSLGNIQHPSNPLHPPTPTATASQKKISNVFNLLGVAEQTGLNTVFFVPDVSKNHREVSCNLASSEVRVSRRKAAGKCRWKTRNSVIHTSDYSLLCTYFMLN